MWESAPDNTPNFSWGIVKYSLRDDIACLLLFRFHLARDGNETGDRRMPLG
jgi:hypothetical protein